MEKINEDNILVVDKRISKGAVKVVIPFEMYLDKESEFMELVLQKVKEISLFRNGVVGDTYPITVDIVDTKEVGGM